MRSTSPSRRRSGLAGRVPDLLLDGDVERIQLRAVQPECADAVRDLQAYELAHCASSLR